MLVRNDVKLSVLTRANTTMCYYVQDNVKLNVLTRDCTQQSYNDNGRTLHNPYIWQDAKPWASAQISLYIFCNNDDVCLKSTLT